MKFSKLFLFIFFCFNCKSTPIKKTEDKITFPSKDIIEEVYNKDKTLLLILKYKADQNLPTTFNYKVIDVQTKEEKNKGVFIGSKIEWQDNISLKGIKHIGIVRNDNDSFLTKEGIKESAKNYIVIKINNLNK